MTLAEFKAWFEGYTETIETAPSAKQWERIKARVKEIDGAPVSYPVYIEKYIDRYIGLGIPWRPSYFYGGGGVTGGAIGLGGNGGNYQNNATLLAQTSQAGCAGAGSTNFDSLAAMNSLGRVEAQGEA